MWVFRSFEQGVWTVGFWGPDGSWYSTSDHASAAEAADEVHYLNGGERSDPKSMRAPR